MTKEKSTRVSRRRAVVIVTISTAFMTTFTASSVNLAIPAVSEQFHSSAAMIGWVITGYMLASTSLSVPFGRIADLTGRKRILVIGIFVFSLFSGACAFAPSAEILTVLRIAQGVGGALIFSTNIAILVDAFPPDMRGKVLGYSVAAVYTGSASGPVLGGLLNHYFGWHSIFIVTSALGFAVFLLALLNLSAMKSAAIERPARGRYDAPGICLYVCTVLCTMYGFSALTDVFFAKFLIPAGLAFGVFFVRRERKIASPIVEVRLFARNLNFSLSNLATLLNYSATFAIGYFMSVYLQVILGMSSQNAGFVLISQPLIMALLSPYAGRLSDRISPFKLSSVGMGLCATGLFLFSFISADFPIPLILAGLVIVGVGFGFFSSPNTNAIMSLAPRNDYGVTSSIIATMRGMGHTASMAIVTLIISAHMGTASFAEAPPALLLATMRTGFSVFTVICVIGVFCSMRRREAQPERP
ncbi:MAG: MFS transporter [Clostridiales Family XIII bacterium]|jgi:EmrB/QacA subfamily drug resistance transporter|nr:MFS transporter [Clostridiales Family XIII bacterium]